MIMHDSWIPVRVPNLARFSSYACNKIMAAAKDKVVFVTKEEESEASEGFASDDSAGEASVTKARLHTHTHTHTHTHAHTFTHSCLA
jgi:hypothetical protein